MSESLRNVTSFSGLFSKTSAVNDLGMSGMSGRSSEETLHFEVEEDLFGDPDWFMEQETSPSSDVPEDNIRQRKHQLLQQQQPRMGSFSAIAGMSPCLGVPPVDCFYYGNKMSSHNKPVVAATGNRTTSPIRQQQQQQQQQRRRHFSLEDYHEEDCVLDESSSSNESSFPSSQNRGYFKYVEQEQEQQEAKRRRQQQNDDLNHFRSFINDFTFGEDALHALDVDTAFISASLRAEFECRLRKCIDDSNPDVVVSFPSGLPAVIAGHVLQEAAEEPYGMKGCLLHINFEGETGLHHMGSMDCDPETPAKTFELTLTLRQGQTTWGQRMARRLSFTSSSTLTLSTSYKLVKKRKYRTEAEEPTDFIA